MQPTNKGLGEIRYCPVLPRCIRPGQWNVVILVLGAKRRVHIVVAAIAEDWAAVRNVCVTNGHFIFIILMCLVLHVVTKHGGILFVVGSGFNVRGIVRLCGRCGGWWHSWLMLRGRRCGCRCRVAVSGAEVQ